MTAVDLSAVARVVGIQVSYKDLRGRNITFLPQRVVIMGQGNTGVTYPDTKKEITNAMQAGVVYGYGSPVHLAARQLFPDNGDGVGTVPVTIYPLQEGVSATVASGDITPSGSQLANTQAYARIGGVKSQAFSVLIGDNAAAIIAKMITAINAIAEMPVIATNGTTKVNLASKWKGESANGIYTEVVGDDLDVAFAITQCTGGTVDPDPTDALALIGNIWETCIVSCLDLQNTDALDVYQTYGDGRWGALVKKPLTGVFTGANDADYTDVTVITDARKSDRINSVIHAPDSPMLPLQVAARAVARIARQANNNPPVDYASDGKLQGIVPGAAEFDLDYTDRDFIVKKGCSTLELIDGVLELSDVVTCYHPDGDTLPAYRYVVDIVKIQQILFNIKIVFESSNWRGKPLLPDADATTNDEARKPKDAVSAVCEKYDGLGLAAIIADVAFAKANTFASISESNPKRIDLTTTAKIAGNTNIISVDLDFGFYFGQAA